VLILNKKREKKKDMSRWLENLSELLDNWILLMLIYFVDVNRVGKD
jgi:hypothetical protein